MDDGTLKLEDVAKAAGVSPRTVRYYIQRGLLPAPAFRGPDTAYGEEHVVRLRAIKQLQEAYWPLDAIAGLLASRSERELRELAEGRDVPAPRVATDDEEASAPAAPFAPLPPRTAPRTATTPTITRVRRISLAPGLVLELDEGASDETEALAARITALVQPPTRRRR
jgi:Ca-activated chloride channel family protein